MNAVTAAIIAILFQWTLLLALAWGVHWMCKSSHPRWRVILWRSILCFGLVLPLFSMLRLPRLFDVTLPDTSTSTRVLFAPTPPEPRRTEDRTATSNQGTSAIATSAVDSTVQSVAVLPGLNPARRSSLSWPSMPLLLALIWFAGWLWQTLQLLRLHLQLRRIVRRASPATAPVQSLAWEIRNDLKIRRPVRVRVSDSISSPCLTGVLHPIILLPHRMAEDLPACELSALLSHELAHEARHDLPWCIAWRLLKAVCWFHPLVLRIPEAHLLACEEEADRVAAQRQYEGDSYPRLLAQLALRVLSVPAERSTLALNANSHLARRLIRLGREQAAAWRLAHSLAAFGVMGVLLALTASWQFAQSPAAGKEAPRMKDLKVVVIDASTQQPVAGAEISTFGREPMKLKTDESGVAVLAVRANPPTPEKDTTFTLMVKDPRHEPRQIEWFSDAGRVRETLPVEYKVALPIGGVAGGVVRDERGAPVSGAKIVFYASGLRGRSLGRGDKLQQEYGSISVSEENALVTDEQGRWRQEHFPTDITQISIDVIRPEGARTRFISGTMYRGPDERGGIVDIPQLLAQSAAFTLKEGLTVRGIVVDEEGRPVSGVQLRARDATSRNKPYTFFNNIDGTFTLQHWDVSRVLVTAEKEGHQAKSVTIAAGGAAGSGKIVLTSAKPLIVRVVGENATPLAGAELQSDPNPSTEQIVNWKARTDVNGRAEWPTAPDKPVTIWITPPPGTDYPFRSARLVANGTEHMVHVRRGSENAIRVNFRVIDAESGGSVPKFEVWRRLANQPFKPWGEPADQGKFAREMTTAELPNGFVPSYRLQVRAAGYTGWSSETLDFSYGDQDLTIKLVKGESTLTNEPPSPRAAGMGIDGERDPQLLVLAAAVARLLETGDVGVFVNATNASLDDWKRLLPQTAGVQDLPLGPDPTQIIKHRETAIAASATHVLDLARRAGVTPGKLRFTVKSANSPMSSSSGFKIAGQSVMMPFAMALRIVLTGEPVGETSGAAPRGDYELSISNARKFPSGWRTEAGVRWAAFPERVADEAIRRELSLANRVAPTTFADQRTLSGMDDPALLQFGTIVAELVRQRAVPGFVNATRLSRDETADFYVRTGRAVTAELDEAHARNSVGLAAAAKAMVALQERMGIDLSDAKLTVKQVLAERPSFLRFGQVEGISASSLRITLAAESNRTGKSGQSLAGNYTVAIGNAMRVGGRWVLVEDNIRFQDFPKGLVAADELKLVELENYISEHRTLPPGHAAPEVSFIKLADQTSTQLSAFRGKVVVLEFWAVWCGPCQEPMEKLQHLRDAHPDWKDRVEIITLSIDEKAGEARSHLEKKGWLKTFNVWAGAGAWQAPAPQAFRVRGVPTVYVLDREGRVAKAGHPMSMDLGQIVDEELKKSPR